MHPEHALMGCVAGTLLLILAPVHAAGQEGGEGSTSIPPVIGEPPPFSRMPPVAEEPLIIQDYLDAISLDTIGLIGPESSPLPTELWHRSRTEDLAALFARQTAALPASLLEILYLLLLTETSRPGIGAGDGRLLAARLDSLLTLGAVDQAQALFGIIGPNRPAFYSRWRDLALLDGDVLEVCNRLLVRSSLSSALVDHIYCNHATGNTGQAQNLMAVARSMESLSSDEEMILNLLFAPAETHAPGAQAGPIVLTDDSNVILIRILFDHTHNSGLIPDTVKLAPLRIAADLPAPLRFHAALMLVRSQAISYEPVLTIARDAQWELEGPAAEAVRLLLAFDRAIMLDETGRSAALLDRLFPYLVETGLLHAFADYYAEELGFIRVASSLAQQVILALGGTAGECNCGPLGGDERYLADLIRLTGGIPTDWSDLPQGHLMQSLLAGLAGIIATPGLQDLVEADRHGEALLTILTPFNDPETISGAHLQDAIALLVNYNDAERARSLAIEWVVTEVLP
ncbi:MAG: hypothetical protein OXC91_04695 [Rhodobacteraceae bacterium]|nr:hypothetical protein [Paracoccaceae bacterium]